MWMMGYNEGAEFSMPDSFNGRKLRPLIPRPITSPNNSPCLGRINGSDFFALNHHLGMGDQNKREFNTQQPAAVVVSSRWNPTPEQLRTLEELYRRGTRTPSADQIQHITAQLRRYGKIEGKNVFYWFQNHKARERQKRRRQMESATDDNTTDIFERKDSETNRTGYEAEQTKNWALPTNCSTLAEESVSIQMAAKASVSECRADNGWIQFEEGELPQQQRKNFVERNDTWHHQHKMHFSSAYSCITPPPPTPPPPPSLTSSTAPTAAAIRTATTAAPPQIHTPVRPMDPKHHHHSFFKTNNNNLNIFKSPCRYNTHVLDPFNFARNHHDQSPATGDDSQTLQLFPLRSDNSNEKENEISVSTASPATANLGPNYQFFEFLPLKN